MVSRVAVLLQANQGHLAQEEQAGEVVVDHLTQVGVEEAVADHLFQDTQVEQVEEAVADHLFQELQEEAVADHLLGQAAEVQADLADLEAHPSDQAAEVQADPAVLEVPAEVATGLSRIAWDKSTIGTLIGKCRRIFYHGMDVGRHTNASGA